MLDRILQLPQNWLKLLKVFCVLFISPQLTACKITRVQMNQWSKSRRLKLNLFYHLRAFEGTIFPFHIAMNDFFSVGYVVNIFRMRSINGFPLVSSTIFRPHVILWVIEAMCVNFWLINAPQGLNWKRYIYFSSDQYTKRNSQVLFTIEK